MTRWIKSFLFLLAISGGILAGMPLHAANSQMMECCDKAKSSAKTSEARMARLCCAINCSDSTPTPQSTSFNFSPANLTISESIAEQIAALFPTAKAVPSLSPQYSREILNQTFQPKYIQYNSFLI